MFPGLSRRNRTADTPADAIVVPHAATEPPAPVAHAPDGPRIGIALGGGAARGFAHIGVMRALERNGIRPHVVAGTSIGAAVGGLWAAGKLDELEAWARSLKKRDVLRMLDFTFGSPGIIGGRRLVAQMRRHMAPVRIEDMNPTFAAIATELGSGHEIWLTRGDLVEAIHASFALPGIFTPVKVGGRWLMDGALVNPVPVSAARAMGARIVIAVNLNADIFGKGTVIHDHGGIIESAEDAIAVRKAGFGAILRPDRLLRRQFFSGPADGPRGISSVMIDAFNITQDRIARSRLAGDPPDVSISPKLGKIGLFEFQRADEAIAAGEEAAEKMIDELRAAMVALA
ncbi:patatin-like phospholipase family protein [Xanthobacteraceae bacterium A53D]